MRYRRPMLLLLAVLALVAAFATVRAQTAPQFGDPLPGLPPELLAAFESGKQRFAAVETAATGLGPVFNARSCAECHENPVPGGSAEGRDDFVTRFGRQADGLPFSHLVELGGPALQGRSVAEDLSGCTLGPETIPQQANVTGRRQPPPLFGLGLIQAIPDPAIMAHADPTDANGDGIAGRPNTSNGVIGRFGWKSAVSTIAGFVGLALVNELGITNFLQPNEMAPQGRPIPPGCKLTADIEDADAGRLADMTAFLTFMSPPPRGPITDAARRGETLFAQVGCATCHVPALKTGPSVLAALDRVDVPLYSDLLTHYMGGALDDRLPEGDVGGGRWRTAPLWGLRVRTFLLHDGRTSDLLAAIRLHGGEANRVRERFNGLRPAQQSDLLTFLRSL